MRTPTAFEHVAADRDIAPGPYPAQGFMAVWDAALGNGDYFGCYWPLGREQAEPIVCEMYHDEGTLQPSYSSTARFVEWLALNNGERGDHEVEDPGFGPHCYARARVAMAAGRVDAAILELEAACASVPDVSVYWFALAGQRRRLGLTDAAVEAALNAVLANWSFGRVADGALRMLQTLGAASALRDDPLVRASAELALAFGGSKHNPDYAVLRACIDAYFERGQALHALRLSHNYAYAMHAETTAFQERHAFSPTQWRADYARLCLQHLGDARTGLD
ncbi:tetratricopeptide repeat-containing protein [Lysobacter sp. Root604]|uniref:tetratricopeptide repeat-containing protein n=1 Tax=Lysobacter sp. Root604 TaxID=1736568 RepID=UPI000A51DDC6|nr:tetratricopeptide repeat-containing protein [Lysobacter sp. Root604]